MEIQKYMYVLSQSGKISKNKLKQHLEKFVYDPAPITLGLWRHQTRTLKFSLVVDDFNVQYERQADFPHFRESLKQFTRYLRTGKAS